MTVCIAAIAAESKAIVCIADRALTYKGYGADTETDSGVTKIIDLPGNRCAMFSCDSLTFPKNVLDRIVQRMGNDPVTRSSMETLAKEAYEHWWWKDIEDQILKPILLTKADFAARSQSVQPLDSKLVMKLAEEMSEYKQHCSMIFCGFDGNTPQLFMVNTPCQLDPYDWQGFAVIGGGLESARNQMIWNEYEKDDPLESVLWDVFSSKVATEVIQGVGYAWDWRVLVAGKKPGPLTKKIDKLIDDAWVEHNHSPFGRKLTKSELPPDNWKQILKEFSDELLGLSKPKPKPKLKPSTSRKSKGQR